MRNSGIIILSVASLLRWHRNGVMSGRWHVWRQTLLPLAFALLLVSCGRNPDPPFTSMAGDLGAFLDHAISGNPADLRASNNLTTSWSFRVLTDRDRSGEYLDGRQALQVATAKTNFAWAEAFLTQKLGAPAMPVRQEQGWRHVGWSRSDPKLGIWLVELEDQCRIEIVTETGKSKP